jgi:hypothetical protein
MRIEELLLTSCGFEEEGENFKFFVAGPKPGPSTSREQGVRTSLFHLFSGEDAEAIRHYLQTHPAWEARRVPPHRSTSNC